MLLPAMAHKQSARELFQFWDYMGLGRSSILDVAKRIVFVQSARCHRTVQLPWVHWGPHGCGSMVSCSRRTEVSLSAS